MTLDALPGHARLWVHTADRVLTAEEVEAVESGLAVFIATWAAHGQALKAAGAVLYGRVLVVGLDEQQAGATGCSIDKLVGWVRAQGEQLGVDWFDRHQVVWRSEAGAGWQGTRTPEFWAMRKAGVVQGATEVVDPLASTVGAARSERGWLVKTFDESWHAEMWS